MMEHPLSKLWPAIAGELEEQIPDMVRLPRDEIIRFFKTMYFMGMANAMLGMTTLELMTDDDDDKEMIRSVYFAQTADMVKANRSATLEQLIATIEAHKG